MKNSYLEYFKETPFPSILLKPQEGGTNFTIEDVNQAFLETLGFQREDVLKKDYLTFICGGQIDKVNISASVLKTSLEFVRIYKSPRKIEKFHFALQTSVDTKEEFTCEVENIPILDDNNEVAFILQMGKEIIEEPVGNIKNGKLNLLLLQTILAAFREHPEFEGALAKALQLTGEGLGVERAYYFVNGISTQTGKKITSQKFEWSKDAYWDESENTITQDVHFEEIEELINVLEQKEAFCRNTVELEGGFVKEILEGQQIQSVFILPIFVKEEFHGFIGFDACTQIRSWTGEEQEFLSCVGSIITSEIEKKLSKENEEYYSLLLQTVPGLSVGEGDKPALSKIEEGSSQGAEKIYKTIIDYGAELISIIDDRGMISFMSGSLNRLLGWKVERVLGRAAMGMVHPEDKFRVMKKLLFLSPARQVKFSPFRVKDNLGFWKWVEGTAINLCQDAEIKGTILHMRDVTDLVINNQKLKLSNERFRFAMMATDEMIWDWDLLRDKVTRSRGYQRLLRLSSQPDINGWLWLKFVHKEDIQRVRGFLKETIADKNRNQWKMAYRMVRDDKTIIYVEDRGYIVRDDKGEAVRMVGATLDVTQSTALMEAVKEQNRQLKEIAWVQSHVVRAPLARIMGLVNMLELENEEVPLDEKELKDVLRHLSDSAHELDRVIQKIVRKSEQVVRN
jgi:PAS domain S-box-containing protein